MIKKIKARAMNERQESDRKCFKPRELSEVDTLQDVKECRSFVASTTQQSGQNTGIHRYKR
jgi:hypothetical protein